MHRMRSMAEQKELRRNTLIGTAAIALGSVAALAGALAAHFTGLDEVDGLGREIYPSIPRGWVYETIGQTISLTGVLILLGGITLAFLYQREMTWARASIGAVVFVSVMMILFGIIPNEWLTLTQSTLEWTPQKIAITIPPALVLNNDVAISFAAIKDIVSGTYAVVVLGAVIVAMYQWQEYEKKRQSGPPPTPISDYGRPLTKVDA